jgi:septal ring factor EnvC (AmiA/AmiB activator)
MEMLSASVKFIIILVLTFNLLCCEEQEILAQDVIDPLPDSINQTTEQRTFEDSSSLDVGIDSLMKLIEMKQEEFQALEQQLQQKSIELAEKEREFTKIETDIRMIHDNSSLLFCVGLVLFIGGAIFFLVIRKPRAKN